MKKYRAILAALLLVAAALLWLLLSVDNLAESRAQQGRQLLEDAIRRAAVACYAAEGIYPPDLDYLTQHYGVQLDSDRYVVVYDCFADNLMPDITVLETP